jgi:hypothetical protein
VTGSFFLRDGRDDEWREQWFKNLSRVHVSIVASSFKPKRGVNTSNPRSCRTLPDISVLCGVCVRDTPSLANDLRPSNYISLLFTPLRDAVFFHSRDHVSCSMPRHSLVHISPLASPRCSGSDCPHRLVYFSLLIAASAKYIERRRATCRRVATIPRSGTPSFILAQLSLLAPSRPRTSGPRYPPLSSGHISELDPQHIYMELVHNISRYSCHVKWSGCASGLAGVGCVLLRVTDLASFVPLESFSARVNFFQLNLERHSRRFVVSCSAASAPVLLRRSSVAAASAVEPQSAYIRIKTCFMHRTQTLHCHVSSLNRSSTLYRQAIAIAT